MDDARTHARTHARTQLTFLGSSPAAIAVRDWIAVAARTDATVLIGGETGTGKTLVARAIHEASARSDGPFTTVDCGALAATLIESELFGAERSAYTGATERRVGLIEASEGGTVFLDEIGELPFDLQPRLLRVLDERVVRRVGGREPIPVDVRFIAATHQNLTRMVVERRFRQDLFFRLNVVSFSVPPLRERHGDIAEIAHQLAARLGGRTLAEGTVDHLLQQPWPGNVRELQNTLERALALTPGPQVDPATVCRCLPLPPPPVDADSASCALVIERIAREICDLKLPLPLICAAVGRMSVAMRGGNVSAAARDIGIGRKALARAVARARDAFLPARLAS